MKKVARAYNVFVLLPFIALPIMLLVGTQPIDAKIVAKTIGFLLVCAPLALGVVTLGPTPHRWEQYALWGNRILTVFLAGIVVWAAFTPKEQVGIYAIVMLASVLNWASLEKDESRKSLVISASVVWVVGFMFAGTFIESDGGRKREAAMAGINVIAFYVLGGGAVITVLTFAYMKMNGIGGKTKDDPISKATRAGDLAFKNEEPEESNPYLVDNPELSKAWKDGYSKAKIASKNRQCA